MAIESVRLSPKVGHVKSLRKWNDIVNSGLIVKSKTPVLESLSNKLAGLGLQLY